MNKYELGLLLKPWSNNSPRKSSYTPSRNFWRVDMNDMPIAVIQPSSECEGFVGAYNEIERRKGPAATMKAQTLEEAKIVVDAALIKCGYTLLTQDRLDKLLVLL